MNKSLKIVVEGQTELEFVKQLIIPYMLGREIYNIRPITIETSPGHKGGDIQYEKRYKKEVKTLLRGKEDLLVTSMIDYYGLKTDFPNYEQSRKLPDSLSRVELIEKGCFNDINDERFIPYIQLHEFEGLLFSSTKGFEQAFPDLRESSKRNIETIIEQFPNPEQINDHFQTAPSKRIIGLLPEYQKSFHGPLIANGIGFEVIMYKCPRFRNWIDTLVKRMQE